jgi:2-polyprenyl-3-methyl-5-hydroxy-6-metoxy-1,4-benzoquinol methylase
MSQQNGVSVAEQNGVTVCANLAERLNNSRNILYDPNTCEKDFVKTFNDWAHTYDQDIESLGGNSWDYAIERFLKLVPNRDSLILDFCGGTGIIGEKLKSIGYRNLHISDGSVGMLAQAKSRDCFNKIFHEVVSRDTKAKFLEESVQKGVLYDCILSSECVTEFRIVTEQMIREAVKPGGYLMIIESVPHVEEKDLNLDGIYWLLDEVKKPNSGIELVEHRTDLVYDQFNSEKAFILVVRRAY